MDFNFRGSQHTAKYSETLDEGKITHFTVLKVLSPAFIDFVYRYTTTSSLKQNCEKFLRTPSTG